MFFGLWTGRASRRAWQKTSEDRDAYFGGSIGRRVVAIESAWLQRIRGWLLHPTSLEYAALRGECWIPVALPPPAPHPNLFSGGGRGSEAQQWWAFQEGSGLRTAGI